MKRQALIAATLLSLVGCSQSNSPISPSSFALPGNISFTCVRLAVKNGAPAALVPLDACRVEDDAKDPKTHAAIALVTQEAIGAVAAIDLRDQVSLDSNPLVPGFTYVSVGEIPTDIVTLDPTDASPSVTFVSSLASRSVEAVDTARFHPDVADTEGYVTTVVDLPDGPTALAFVETTADPALRGYLYATLPNEGTIAQIAVLANGTLDVASLSYLTPDPASAPAPTAADESAPYQRVCPADTAYRDAVATARPALPAAMPLPSALAVDAESRPQVLLVADAANGVVHRFAVDEVGATALPGINVAAATLDVAVTPSVARSLDVNPLTQPELVDARYLYAVDAADGSILAVDYAAASPTFGAVLAVSSGDTAPDRISYTDRALAIEVLTPELRMAFNPASETPGICDPVTERARADDALPTQLRGVYLSVGLSTGYVGIVDVWDLEATCRGGASCTNPDNRDDVFVSIRRHRPRSLAFSPEAPGVVGAPSLSYGTNPGSLKDTGVPASGNGPGLRPTDCAAEVSPYMIQGFPDPSDAPALICIFDDPWSVPSQRVTATFDGVIPFTPGGDGRIVIDGAGMPGAWLVAPGVTFCDFGVLGRDDVVASALGATDPEAGYGGDQIEITSDLPVVTRDLERCEAFDIPDDGDLSDRDPIRFAVLAARDGALELGELDVPLADVLACFPHAFNYQVRTRGAYVVERSVEGVTHRVVSDAGACRVDTANQPVVVGNPETYANFRALPGRTFIVPSLAFQITPAGVNQDQLLGIDDTSVLAFDVRRYPVPATIDISSQPLTRKVAPSVLIESMRYNPVDDRLYVVDSVGFRVAQVSTDSARIIAEFD